MYESFLHRDRYDFMFSSNEIAVFFCGRMCHCSEVNCSTAFNSPQMYTYVTDELPKVINANFNVNPAAQVRYVPPNR